MPSTDQDLTTAWPHVPPTLALPDMEREVLGWWDDRQVFAKSLEQRRGGPEWSFYEGPPTANGRPGTHHVEARTFKDIFPRHRTMKGYHVVRRGGWDCHGLPVELEVEKELSLSSKADIEAFGVEEFNQRCRQSVTRYVDAWRELTERIGFWVDMDDPYWTMDPAYIDSLWWALQALWERDLIFEDHRVAPYCARCGTGLSDAEVSMGYASTTDPSVYVRFPILDGPLAERGASLLVWTTTPWTLPSNVAVAVGADIAYQLVDAGGDLVVVAADRREAVLGDQAAVVEELAADDLAGLHYQAPFTIVDVDDDYRYVTLADFVTTTDGTGMVHIAPAFGVDDLELGRQVGLPVVNPVDLDGRFTSGPWQGLFVKDADEGIVAALAAAGVLLQSGEYQHTYPFCWRCSSPLIYYAKPSWYIRTTAMREELLANNATIDWHPEHIRDGRFGNWLENNVDWALSRDRYWGTPLPFWRCQSCDHVTVVGSRAELGQLVGADLSDLDPHRPYVDEIVVPCPSCGGDASRVPEVADAWFDSGAMPFAQHGYPHVGHDEFDRHFPAQYICEAIDQTRGWFYTLLAEGTLLFDRAPMETVLCLGHIIDEDGRKMSKSLGNIIDPWDLIDAHGADALRWLMLAEGNPWVSRRVGHNEVAEVVRRFLLTIWNTHHFFCTYAAIDGFALSDAAPAPADRPASDRWALAELADTVTVVDDALEAFDVSTACRRLEQFVDDLSNWYVRRNRRRFWRDASQDPADKAAAYHTLHTCLGTLARLLAPFTPFVAERLWEDLVRSQDAAAAESVHLTDFPGSPPEWRDDPLREAMATTRTIVELGRQARNDSGLKTRQPLAAAVVGLPAARRDHVRGLLDEIADELNVKHIEVHESSGAEFVERSLKPNFRAIGPAFGKDAQPVAEALRTIAGTELDALVAELEAGRASLTVDGRSVELSSDMVELVETPKTGWQVAGDAEVNIALDTTITDELRVEGAARDLIRGINQLRKALDLALDQRVQVVVDAPAELDAQLEAAGLYDVVGRETIASEVRREPAGDRATAVDVGEFGTAAVTIIASPGTRDSRPWR